jgi:hypothetical protein
MPGMLEFAIAGVAAITVLVAAVSLKSKRRR